MVVNQKVLRSKFAVVPTNQSLKATFYVLRPVLACKWIEKNITVPPIDFQELLNEIIFDDPLKTEIQQLLQRKMAGEELNMEPRIEIINEYLENEIKHIEAYCKNLHVKVDDSTQKLDALFRSTL
ncbi:DNA polymerase beta superfamily protein [Lysinibacillus sp. NPDC094403]|uniref:DNA polymerase beta superfamily protein n=1 Tax=Lysinibacillus sp. NPDC094403 TaxID=3390581 RepID=UPI003CFFE53F